MSEEKPVLPDYSGEAPAPKMDAMQRLSQLAVKMGSLELKKLELEEEMARVEAELKTYQMNLVPEVMAEIGLTEIKTKGGMTIELRQEVRASLPKDPEKRDRAFAYLKDTGNDGLITQEIIVNYGRDAGEFAEQLLSALEQMNVREHATVEHQKTINFQSMLAFLRRELKEGKPVPLEAFGAFVQNMAKLKLPK